MNPSKPAENWRDRENGRPSTFDRQASEMESQTVIDRFLSIDVSFTEVAWRLKKEACGYNL